MSATKQVGCELPAIAYPRNTLARRKSRLANRVLVPADFCRYTSGPDSNGRCCLSGWMAYLLPYSFADDSAYAKFRMGFITALRRVIHRELDALKRPQLRRPYGEGSIGDIVQFNDDRGNPYVMLARVWNRAAALIGFTKGNPEATWARRNRSTLGVGLPKLAR
jgi:hypothetical protein